MNTYTNKKERSQIKFDIILQGYKKKEQSKPRIGRKKEIKKIRAEISGIEHREKQKRLTNIKISYLKRETKSTNLRQTNQRKKREGSKQESLQLISHRYNMIMKYCEQLCFDKLDNLEEMETFLETCKLPN